MKAIAKLNVRCNASGLRLTASRKDSISSTNTMLGVSLFHWTMAMGKKEYL